MFNNYISMNWEAKPLRSFKDVLGYIGETTTETGLTVKATLVEKIYTTGEKIADSVFHM
ncbi:MAG: hypothetical protein R8L53_02400 [Mariprofundales bacterium]